LATAYGVPSELVWIEDTDFVWFVEEEDVVWWIEKVYWYISTKKNRIVTVGFTETREFRWRIDQ
jgi:hypothetical protein